MHEHFRICEQACRQAHDALGQLQPAGNQQVDLDAPSQAAPQIS